ncbi:MAG: hypothetical protein EB168_11035 [Euryarchaeota archaeon]|nr:hypothetical protein [Euryarchaeota archaeon]
MSNELRQEHAKRLLEDKLFTETVDALRDQLAREWRDTEAHDVDTREQIWLELKLVDRMMYHFESIIQSGEITKLTSKLGKF